MDTTNGALEERELNRWEIDASQAPRPYTYYQYDVDRKEKIATVTMQPDPKGRCVAPGWSEHEMMELIDRFERDDDVKVVIFKSGGVNFCTGHNLGDYLAGYGARDTARSATPKKRRRTNRENLLTDTRWMPRLLMSLKPTIAQVHGQAIEFGCALAMHCDMVIASDDAHFGHLGQTIGMSGFVPSIHYISAMGYKRFREMMTCGRTYSGADAIEMGLANRIVPRAELEAEVMNEARRIALIPLDGLVTGKLNARLGLQALGAQNASDISGVMWAGYMPNLKHEPGEFHFFEVVREQGLEAAIRQRQALYEPLGGFGVKNELPRVRAAQE
jgi:enoyl-CoA hydratase